MIDDIDIKYRHELKYQCSIGQIEIIKNRLKNLVKIDTHTKNGLYTVESLYFDNYANRCYYENQNGTDPREKFRIRIYNGDDSRISLECKRKEKGKNYKTTCLLTKDDYKDILSGGSFKDFENKPDLYRKLVILQKTELFKPAVITQYERIPYIYKDGNVRITIDMNIRSSTDFNKFLGGNLKSRPILPQGQHLIEVKYDEFLPDFIKEVLEIGNLQQTNFSKYYLCRKFSSGGIV